MPVYFEGKRKKVRYGRDLVEVRFGKKTKKEAFAVFSADDNSLNFYKRVDVPKVGDMFEGRAVTGVYTGIETDVYERDKNVPWYMNAQLITNVNVVDIIKPISTAYWFSRCYNLVQLDILNIDTLNVTSMQGMFALCKSLIEIDLSGFDTSNVISMRTMFAGCSNLASLDVNNFNTSKVTNMSRMFGQCSSLANLSISNFNTSSVSDMSRMFEACSSIVELNLSHFNIKSVMNTYGMFRECKSLVNIDISGWNTSSVTNMSEMFAHCSALIRLNISNIDTAHVTNMSMMFSSCSSLRFLNISSFDTQRVEDMAYMFDMCNNLQKIQLGNKFAWRGVHGELPTPSSSDIPGADGKWYAESDGRGYTPENIPSNKADTYYAYPPQAFAVYSDDDKSLNFYKRFGVPKAGGQFDGKTVAGVYTGIENAQYEPEWESIKQKIKYVTAIDKISPVFMSGWFANMHNLHTADLNKIDVSKTVDLSYIFYMSMSSNEPFRVNIESWNISDVCNINSMFDELIPGGSVGGIACIILGSGSAKIAARLPFAQAETGYGAMNVKTKQPESYEQIAAGNGGEYVFKRINYGLYAWNGDYWKR